MKLIKTMLDMKNIFPTEITNEWINKMPRRQLDSIEHLLNYSSYYYKDMAHIPQDDLDIVNAGPIDVSKALPISECHKLLKKGYLKGEVGYCLMPDKTAFAATKVFMPNVTPDMINWWFNWHPLENLRYAIWCRALYHLDQVKTITYLLQLFP